MIISVIGECDNRPVLYTLMKICQTLGDVLLVTPKHRLLRLSDTRDSGGHLQNIMIGIADNGIDDFFDDFLYQESDFAFVIADNIISADAGCVIYTKGLLEAPEELIQLECIENYTTIDLFGGIKLVDKNTLMNCEEFEAYKDFCTINPQLSLEVAKALSGPLSIPVEKLQAIANAKLTNKYVKAHPKPKPNLSAELKKMFGKVGVKNGS